MKRILLTYTLAFILLPVYGGEGGSSPAVKYLFRMIFIKYGSPHRIAETITSSNNPMIKE